MSDKTRLRLLLLLLLITVVGAKIYYDVKQILKPATVENIPLAKGINRLKASAVDKRLEIELNPMLELDFKTNNEVLHLRQSYVAKHAELVEGEYHPSKAIFGPIASNRPWWGIEGIYYYGNTDNSISGLSEESRHLANPFLLIGIQEVWAYRMHDSAHWHERYQGPPPDPLYFPPSPKSLVWQLGKNPKVEIVYNVSGFFAALEHYKYPNANKNLVGMSVYNARDFGFGYMYIDGGHSENIKSKIPPGRPLRLVQFIHLGSSCGYPGGCNNMSPDQNETNLTLLKLPAKAHIKLWQDEPKNVEQEADLTVLLKME